MASESSPSECLRLKNVSCQLHSAQTEINNLRLINVCLQSTLFRVQSQLIDFLPVNQPDEIKRNEVKEKIASIRHVDDQTRRHISAQELSFRQLFSNVKNLFDSIPLPVVSDQETRLSKHQKQIEILHEMFHEFNTIIHTEHHDRICQLYLTLAETARSVHQARSILDRAVQAQKNRNKKQIRQRITLSTIIVGFLSAIVLIIVLSIRLR